MSYPPPPSVIEDVLPPGRDMSRLRTVTIMCNNSGGAIKSAHRARERNTAKLDDIHTVPYQMQFLCEFDDELWDLSTKSTLFAFISN